LIAFLVLRRFEGPAAQLALLAASLGFYAWWDIRFLPLLVGSFSFNYLAGLAIFRCVIRGRASAGHWLAGAIVLNLGTLGLFKYTAFATANVNLAFGTDFV